MSIDWSKKRSAPTAADLLAAERARMEVSSYQAKMALAAAGLLEAATAIVEQQDLAVRLALTDKLRWRRTHPIIATVQPIMGLTDEQVDDLFRAAALIPE